MKYFPYSHIEPEITIISQLFKRPDLRESYFVNLTAKQLLDQTFLLGDGQTLQISNRELVFRYYTQQDKSKYKTADDIDENAPIRLNTTLYVVEDNIRRDLLFSQTLNIQKTYSTNAFISQKLKELMTNSDYVKSYKFNNVPNTVRKQSPEVQVFMWVRSLLNGEPLSSVDLAFAKGRTIDNYSLNSFISTSKNTKTLDNNPDSGLEGGWIDVSPFIESLNTNNTESGGNFSLSLSPVVCEYDENEGWVLEPFSVKNYIGSDINNSYLAKSALHKIQNGELKRNQFLFHTLLSENDLIYIKFEPLVLEEKGPDPRNRIKQKLRLLGTDIPAEVDILTGETTQERIYDMIGMVDVNQIGFNYQSTDVNISIQGRDLVKTIIEDGTYFFPAEFAQGMFLSPGDADLTNSRLVKRLMFNGAIQNLGIYYEKTIQTVMQFILTQLSNTGFVPSSIFYGYKDRRNTTLTLDQDFQRNEIQDRQDRLQESLDKISQNIAKARAYYRSTNLQLGRDRNAGILSATLNDMRQMVIDFAQFLIDNDMVEDSSGDGTNYYFSTFSPWLKTSVFKTSFKNKSEKPNSKSIVYSNIYPRAFEGYLYPESSFSFREELGKRADGINIIYKSVFTALTYAYTYVKLKQPPKQVPVVKQYLQGVWQIIDLIIDSSVRNRILVDTSISQEQGSLINTINKVCQKPLVEFFTDTYGDKFYFIIRKPPFDEKSILGMVYGKDISTETDQSNNPSDDTELDLLKGTILGKDQLFKTELLKSGIKVGQFLAVTTPPPNEENTGIIIDIEEGDILNDNLSWYNNEVYSWYRLSPQGYLWGTSEAMTWAFLPAIYFEEYSDIWGNKPYIITVSYLPLKGDREANSSFKQDPVIVQSYYDLKYIIDSHCYLPFTRQGSVQLNGDRRIKRGTWVRLKGTGEIGYVDSVSQSYVATGATERTTTIQLSRVMVEDFLVPQIIPGIVEPVSYFNIINTNLKLSEKQGTKNTEGNIRKYAASLDFTKPLLEKIQLLSNRFGVDQDQAQRILNGDIGDDIILDVSQNPLNQDFTIDLRPETVLSNFKVNKEVFNFFLQKRQKNDL